MGQQQLLLLVLGIVIVGLAVVVGIQAFGENQDKARIDAVTADAAKLIGDIQAWKTKPKAFGGVGEDDLSTVSIEALGYVSTEVDGRPMYLTQNGGFWVDSPNNGCVDIWGTTAVSLSNPTPTAGTMPVINVQIRGNGAEDIRTVLNPEGTSVNCATS